MKKCVQNANSLFKFMTELRFLKEILENKAIIPKYCDEDISYLKWDWKFLTFPMVCFCNIDHVSLKEIQRDFIEFIVYNKTYLNKLISPDKYDLRYKNWISL